MPPLTIHVDGGAAGVRHVGIAAIARTPEGYFCGWLSQQLPRMTNNEAEYRAALLGLDLAEQLAVRHVLLVSDSEVLVRQMTGQSRVLSNRLRHLHERTCQRVADFTQVQFQHVTRQHNALADALATEAIAGRLVRMPPHKPNSPLAVLNRPTQRLQSWLAEKLDSSTHKQ